MKKLKKILAVLTAVLMIPVLSFAGITPGAITAAAADDPYITISKIPALNSEDKLIIGEVHLPDGESYEDYFITAYIEVDGRWWGPKKTLAEPTSPIFPNGKFILQCASDGQASDLTATGITVFLIEAETTVFSFTSLSSLCVAKTLITRDSEKNYVDGFEAVPAADDFTDFDLRFPGVRKDIENSLKYSVNYSPYTEPNQSPSLSYAPKPTNSQVEKQLRRLSANFDSVRFFTADTSLGFVDHMYTTAKNLNLKVIGTAWIDEYMTESQIYVQLDNLIALAKEGKVTIASVGSEVIYRKDLTPQKLMEYIFYVKNKLNGYHVPVTYMDTSSAFSGAVPGETASYIKALLELNDACDLILYSHYPIFSSNYSLYWMNDYEGGPMQYAIDELKGAHNAIKSMMGSNKPCILAETGWTTNGPSRGYMVPNEENSRKYWDDVHDWAKEENIDVFWFNAYDEQWKGFEAGLDARHWGLYKGDGTVKPVFADLLPQPQIMGDVDGDGEINAWDVAELSKYLVGINSETEIDIAAADVNGDGIINAWDVTELKKYIVGLPSALG